MTLAMLPMGFGFDPLWFILMIPAMLLGLWAQFKLRSTFSRYSQVANARGLTGADTARIILDRNGLSNVEIYPVDGDLTDHYDPTKRAVFLSQSVYGSPSLAALGVAAHEVGHAIQHKAAYAPLELRMKVVKTTNFASQAGPILFMIGMFLNSSLGSQLMWLGIILFSTMALFQAITLPVEFDASRRAKEELGRLGLVSPQENQHVGSVLSAAALTYVAALVTSMMQLLYYVMIARRQNRD